MKLADFDYDLPEELIAQEPVEPRDHARLLVIHKDHGCLEHKLFYEIIEYLHAGDALVLNDTRVIPARLFGIRAETGAKIEFVLLNRIERDKWEVLVKPGRKARLGSQIIFGNGELEGRIIDTTEAGGRIIEFIYEGVFEDVLDKLGQMPLPPYIKKQLSNRERYQTVYAREEGSAAAPTAGLHFTQRLLEEIEAKGVKLVFITLHVGLGTFRPVKVENIEEHTMHSEYYEVSSEAAALINAIKAKGGRVISVGTTTTRTLETVCDAAGLIHPGKGWTNIFIYPGYKFKVVDGLVTNFHLPKSTLLMLVSAFAGREKILYAYREAVANGYRFFSFGDATLII